MRSTGIETCVIIRGVVGIRHDERITPLIVPHWKGWERYRLKWLDHGVTLSPTVTRLGILHGRTAATWARTGASNDGGEFIHGGKFPGPGPSMRRREGWMIT